MTFRRWWRWGAGAGVVIAGLLTGAGVGRAATIAPADLTDAQVVEAIKKGVDFLFKHQRPDGTWETHTEFSSMNPETGGETALVLDALLQVGDSIGDVRLARTSKELAAAVKFCKDYRAEATYAASFQATVMEMLPRSPETLATLERDRFYLISSTRRKGGHFYSIAQSIKDPNIYDHSNSNYALLGLTAVADTHEETSSGMGVPLTYWQTYENLWRSDQNADGGWGYAPGRDRPESNPSMTAAGVASLYLLKSYTDTEVRLEPKPDKTLESALAYLSQSYNPDTENYYYLYSLERVGMASGLKLLAGTHDWYREGVSDLLKRQAGDGSWITDRRTFWVTHLNENVCTAYAIMFLARGRNAVLFNKLEYNGPWNARPRDAANVTEWASRKFERPINWQVVNLQVDAKEWSDAPVLLITGSKDPQFTEGDIRKLQAYIEAGGMILSTADGSSQAFTTAIRKVAAKVVYDKYEMRELPREHPVYTLWKKAENAPKLWGMSNGAREVWIHSPVDLGATWQRKAFNVESQWDVIANMYFYASGTGGLSPKLVSLDVPVSPAAPARTIHLARLQYAGNYDPEPGAWPRMAKLAEAGFHTKLEIVPTKLGELDAAKTPVAHMTGTAAFAMSDDEKTKLKDFLAKGGTLLVDACGGSDRFSECILGFLKEIAPDAKMDVVPMKHAIFTGTMPDGAKIPEVAYRKAAAIKMGTTGGAARLLGAEQNGRYVILFSNDDLTSGLLGTNTAGIAGYTPACAQNIVRNILLYATGGKAVAAK